MSWNIPTPIYKNNSIHVYSLYHVENSLLKTIPSVNIPYISMYLPIYITVYHPIYLFISCISHIYVYNHESVWYTSLSTIYNAIYTCTKNIFQVWNLILKESKHRQFPQILYMALSRCFNECQPYPYPLKKLLKKVKFEFCCNDKIGVLMRFCHWWTERILTVAFKKFYDFKGDFTIKDQRNQSGGGCINRTILLKPEIWLSPSNFFGKIKTREDLN